jgi:CARDB
MRTSLLAASAITSALALPPLAASHVLPAGPTPSSQDASVSVIKCSRSPREAVFRGRMRTIAGGERMAMRFTLLEYTGGDFEPFAAPGLGAWRSSRPGVTNFGYRQGIRGLADDAAYRVRVDFRWYSSDEQVIARARRRSLSCRQFDAVANLRVRLTEVRATRVPGVVRYGVRVVNSGRADASAAPVALSVDGDVVDTTIVAALEAGETRELGFRGPECEHSVEAKADPDGAIVESSERDNLYRLRCGDLRRG